MVTRILKYLTALLGLWLVIEISVFPTGAALWIAFATALAAGLVALADFGFCIAERRVLASGTAATTALLSAFLVVASLVFPGASMGWLMAIAGAVIVTLALGAVGLPRLHVSAGVVAFPERGERAGREEERVAA